MRNSFQYQAIHRTSAGGGDIFRWFPQTKEFIRRISELLVYLIPHYIEEGKSYLTIAFGCTGGKHRSVMIAEDVKKQLAKAGYNVKAVHRDSPEAA